MRCRQPDEGPRPRHDPINVVASAAGCQPPSPGPSMGDGINEASDLAHRGRGDAQVRQRIPGVRVRAVLRDDEIGSKRRRERRQEVLQSSEPGILTSPRIQGQIDGGPRGLALPEFFDETRPREQGCTRLVDRERQHAGIVPMDRLDAIPVMDVEIDVQHPQPRAPSSCDRDRRVVVDAEPRGLRRHGVVQAPARVEGVERLAGDDRLDGPDAAAGHRGRSVMHARERRRVARPESGLARTEGGIPHPPHDADVGRVMDPLEDGIARRLGSKQPGLAIAHRREKFDRRREPSRRQRMRRPEVVPRGPRPVHEERLFRRQVRGARHQQGRYRAAGGVAVSRPRDHRSRRDPSGTITACPTRW